MSMCTWLAIETIEYFQRHGSDVYACVMDMTKAFDKVRHSTLFQKLIRLLVVMYEKQVASVKWNARMNLYLSITV